MKILFEGRLGTWDGSCVLRWPVEEDGDCLDEDGRLTDCDTALVTASGLRVEGREGGGYGEIEILVTEAEWA